MIGAVALSIGALLTGGSASAAVVEAQPNGFEIRQTVQMAATPDKVWASLVNVGGWWASSHTYSGDARNLSLEVRPGGCWCEALPSSGMGGGGVEHLRVIYADPGKLLRLSGAIGPLQVTGGTGQLTFALAPKDGGTAMTLTMVFGGYSRTGLNGLAAPVDGVLAEQVARLKIFAETGKAP
jgi:uncharacterized protein YndB with AHSA1/START domain